MEQQAPRDDWVGRMGTFMKGWKARARWEQSGLYLAMSNTTKSSLCPCGRTTGHGESCSGKDPAWWCHQCYEIYKLKQAEQPSPGSTVPYRGKRYFKDTPSAWATKLVDDMTGQELHMCSKRELHAIATALDEARQERGGDELADLLAEWARASWPCLCVEGCKPCLACRTRAALAKANATTGDKR